MLANLLILGKKPEGKVLSVTLHGIRGNDHHPPLTFKQGSNALPGMCHHFLRSFESFKQKKSHYSITRAHKNPTDSPYNMQERKPHGMTLATETSKDT